MKSKVSFHNVDHSQALVSFIDVKSVGLERLLWNGEAFNWVIERDAKDFQPHLILKLRNKSIRIQSHAKNAFQAVNEVFEKAKRLVKSNHKKLK